MLSNAENFPLLAEEGWTRQLIEAGAPGAKREPDRAKPQLMVSSTKLFRPEDFAKLTTITASRYRARASRPSAARSVASQLLVDAAASPPLRGGEYALSYVTVVSKIPSQPRRPPPQIRKPCNGCCCGQANYQKFGRVETLQHAVP